MSESRQPPDFPLKGSHPYERETDRDLRIAYLLQQGEHGDPRLLEMLVEVYGGEIYRFALALLEGERSSDQAWELAIQTFSAAVTNLDECVEEQSVRRWLMKRARRLARRPRSKAGERSEAGNPREALIPASKPGEIRPLTEVEAHAWAAVEAARGEDSLVLALYYIFDLDIPGIAAVAGVREARVRQSLEELHERLTEFGELEERYSGQPHADLRKRIQENLFARPAPTSTSNNGLEEHLSACPDCRLYARQLRAFENTLRESLRKRWPQPELELEQIAQMQAEGRAWLEHKPPRRGLPLKQLLWTGGILLVFISLGWGLWRVTLENVSPPAPPEPRPVSGSPPLALPAPLAISEPAIVQAEIDSSPNPDLAMFSLQPALSSDGRGLVFSSSASLGGPTAMAPGTQLYSFDVLNGTLSQVELNSDDSSLPYSWKLDPGLSADGRFVVFTAVPIDAGTSFTQSQRTTGIFLHDLETGLTERIDRGFDGSPADGDSYSPSISADGRFVAYWSSASNLVPGDPESCQRDDGNQPCLDVFVHDRHARKTFRIPVGRNVFLLYASDRPGISLDGRLVAITLYASDLAAEELDLASILGSYLYDLQAGEFLPVNLSSHGEPGNDLSYAIALSADGRFAAFASDSSNLVPGDENGIADLFVHDLALGVTELVDGPEDGAGGFDSYGRNYPFNSGWGNELSLSSDGRYLAFLSSAEIIANSPAVLCTSKESGCNVVLVYDRETGEIEQITEPIVDRKYLFPSISADGRWVSFMESVSDCNRQLFWRVCADVWLYDRERDRLIPVSKGAYPLAEAMWISEGDLKARDPDSPNLASMEVGALLISPDHKALAGTFGDSRMGLWDLTAGDQVVYLKNSSKANITAMAFSQNGNLVAAGDSAGNVEIWKRPGNERAYLLDEHPGEVRQLGFSSAGERLFVRTSESLWAWDRRGEIFVLSGKIDLPESTTQAVAFYPSGQYIAVAVNDDTIWLRAVPSGEVILRLESQAVVSGLAISPDGRFLASAQEGGQVDLWRLETGSTGGISAVYLRTLRNPEPVKQMSFSQDSTSLAVGAPTGYLLVWSIPGFEVIAEPRPRQGWMELNGNFAFDGRVLAAGLEVGGVYLWQGAEDIPEPRFYQRLKTGEQFAPEEAGTDWIGIARRFPIRYTQPDSPQMNLYQANAKAAFAVKAPSFLPLGMDYRGTFLAPNGSVTLTYGVENRPGAQPAGWMALSQRQAGAELEGFPIGWHALVEEVDIEGNYAEYLRGDWTLSQGSAPAWDSNLPTQRLSWEEDGIRFSLSYHQASSETQAGSYVTRADLIAIARSLVDLGMAVPSETDLIAYIDQQERDCLAYVERRGAFIPSETAVFLERTSGCHLIFLGRQLERVDPQLPFAEIDLDGDGWVERLEIVALPDNGGNGTPLEVRLLTPSRTGLYLTRWRYPIDEDFARLEVLPCNGCEQLLSISFSRSQDQGQLLFRWDGQEMVPVLDSSSP